MSLTSWKDPVKVLKGRGVIRMVSLAEGFETGEAECPRECQCRPLQPCNCTLPGRGPKYGPVSGQHTVLFPESPQMDAQWFSTAFTPEGESFFYCLWERAFTFSPEKGVQDSQARSVSVQTYF